jgi:hypothetical protein
MTDQPGLVSTLRPSDRLGRVLGASVAVREAKTVEAITLDTWASRHGDPEIQVMKFDIQGGEIAALRGARRTIDRSTLLIYTEIFFNPLYEGSALLGTIDALLRESGFGLYNIYGPHRDGQGMLTWADAIFVHTGKLGLDGGTGDSA